VDKNNIYKVVCPSCNKLFCKECIKKWLLMEQVAYSCSNCKQPWNLTFIYKSMSLKFINEQLKQNYSNILYKIHYSLNIQPLIDKLHFIKNININIIPILNIIYTINDKHLEHIAQLIYTNFSECTLKYIKNIDIDMINERVAYNIFDIKRITQQDLNNLYDYDNKKRNFLTNQNNFQFFLYYSIYFIFIIIFILSFVFYHLFCKVIVFF